MHASKEPHDIFTAVLGLVLGSLFLLALLLGGLYLLARLLDWLR